MAVPPLSVAQLLMQPQGLPQSPFDLSPGISPEAAPMAQAPADPFVWGQGGQQLTQDDIDFRRKIAAQEMAAGGDYSPVQSWTQGAARLAQGLVGGLDMRNADRASRDLSQQRGSQIAALLANSGAPSGNSAQAAIAAALASSDPSLQSIGKMVWERNNPKPANNDTAADADLYDARLGAGAGNRLLETKLDPIIQIPTPYGPYVGPRSEFASTMARLQGGGGPASTAPGGAQPPPTLPPDFDFGGPTPSASGGFR
jgi:hypothetical protein